MDTLICKPAGTIFSKKEAIAKSLLFPSYYLSFVYAHDERLHIKKYEQNEQEKGWAFLEGLKDQAFIATCSDREKIFVKNIENLPPIQLDERVAYSGVGNLLNLPKGDKKYYSKIRFFKEFGFNEMIKVSPNIFFNFHGRWVIQNILPPSAGMAFIRSDGQLSYLHEWNGDEFKGSWFFNPERAKMKELLRNRF